MGGGIARYHYYFRQDLAKVKDFITTYQDRILFGSDIIVNTAK
jgi:predicted TIM-barrel fold metal-dependent hydrolase